MRMVALSTMLALVGFGCSRTDGPNEKFFNGHTVEHWLDAIKSPEPTTRKKAADVLGNVGSVDPRAIPALIEALKDRDAKVRDAAVLGLSKIGTPAIAAESALEIATKDNDATVRTHATAALERIRGAK